jgi:hypothetical protein
MTVSAEVLTISSTAVALNAETGQVSGTWLKIKNIDGSNAVDLGDSGVLATTGSPLIAGQEIEVQLSAGEILYAIRTGGSDVDVAVLRTGT